jgi:glutamyl-tRNA synthetase
VSVRVRLAPSPTGNLHIGTARTGVFNWLFARHHGGTFILRIEDTDTERSRPEFEQNILDGLQWLGLNWDEGPFYQSKRLDLYRDAIQQLLDRGLAYRCYTTPEELDALRTAQKAKGQAPRYDNRHRNLTPEQEAAFLAEGRQPVIRFKIDDDRTLTWKDLVRGPVTWNTSDLGGDMVIARAASGDGVGQPLYNLAVVVDDVDMAISHVIRGEDHIANTAKQILLYEAFGATVPEFAHTPLILNSEGRKLSKRDGVTSISDFQQMGYLPEALANYMTLLGWSAPDSTQEVFTLAEAAAQFEFDRVNRAGAKFDWDKLNWLNGQYLHHIPPAELLDRLVPYWQAAGYGFEREGDRPWLEALAQLLSTALTRLDQAADTAALFFADPLDYNEDARAQLQQDGAAAILDGVIAKLAETDALTEDSAKTILNQVTKAAGVKKGLTMRTLRAALTGAMQGPEMMPTWLILDQKGVAGDRLAAARALIG